MAPKVVMVQGTASHAGKSIIVAALCRILRQDGYHVAPFKAQNMSLNSFVTPEGGEIGRAQAVQAEAAGIPPSVDMNPILLKPEADSRSQVVLMGKPHTTISAVEYYDLKAELWPHVTSALDRLSQAYDVVVIEGAGSPAEVNLSQSEIVNMRVARYANAPVLLVGDIERGGVFASLVGTMALLEPEERSLVRAFIINKFRGDIAILKPGLRMLEKRTGVPVAGVIPWFDDICVAEEDVLGLPPNRPSAGGDGNRVRVVVVRLPHLSNFDDFDPLSKEVGVSLEYVSTAEGLDRADLIILPGSKTTTSDLAWLRRQGIDTAILEQHKHGAFVIGICGGYQMLGQAIFDPNGVESSIPEEKGLGLLPISTTFLGTKRTVQVKGMVAAESGLLAKAKGIPLEGYEIHKGISHGQPDLIPFSISKDELQGSSEGAMDAEGRVFGTYIHGLFNSTSLRRVMLENIAMARKKPWLSETHSMNKEAEYDKLAALVRNSLDMDLVYSVAGLERHKGR